MLVQVEIPILDQSLTGVWTLHPLSSNGFELEFSATANVVEMPGDGAQLVAVFRKDFDHNFGRAPQCAANVRDFLR
jgi:hypothetical protein